jgi:hypothetical protein
LPALHRRRPRPRLRRRGKRPRSRLRRRLYERLGYRTVAADDDGVRMALELR